MSRRNILLEQIHVVRAVVTVIVGQTFVCRDRATMRPPLRVVKTRRDRGISHAVFIMSRNWRPESLSVKSLKSR